MRTCITKPKKKRNKVQCISIVIERNLFDTYALIYSNREEKQ